MNSNHQNLPADCAADRKTTNRATGGYIKALAALGIRRLATAKRLFLSSIPLLAVIILIGVTAGNANAQAGRISGRAYLETDGNRGFAASVDAPMPGVPIRLCPASDIECDYTPAGRTLTDAAGFYEFTNLAAGSYSINFGIADATRYSVPVNDEKELAVSYSQFIVGTDSDFTRDFVFDLGIPANSGDFTSFGGGRNAYYGGRIWNDANRNGLYETSEAKFAGVALSLYYDYNGDGTADSPDPLATSVSNAKGQFVLKVSGHTAAPGTYPVLICLDSENFNTGGALVGYQPTAFSTADPNDQVDGDNNIAALTRAGFCTKTLNPLRGKLMPYGGSDRMTFADGAPRDAGNGLFDETIDLGLAAAPAGGAPVFFSKKIASLTEHGMNGAKADNLVYGPTAGRFSLLEKTPGLPLPATGQAKQFAFSTSQNSARQRN